MAELLLLQVSNQTMVLIVFGFSLTAFLIHAGRETRRLFDVLHNNEQVENRQPKNGRPQ